MHNNSERNVSVQWRLSMASVSAKQPDQEVSNMTLQDEPSPSSSHANKYRCLLDCIKPYLLITSAFGLMPFIIRNKGNMTTDGLSSVAFSPLLCIYSLALHGTALGFGIWAMFEHYVVPMLYVYKLTRCIDIMVDLITFASLGVFGLPSFVSLVVAWPKIRGLLVTMARVNISCCSFGTKGFILTPELAWGLCLVVVQLVAEPVWYNERRRAEPNVIFIMWIIIWSFSMSLIVDLVLIALNAALTAAFKTLVNGQLEHVITINNADNHNQMVVKDKAQTGQLGLAKQLETIRLRHAELCKISQKLADTFSYWILTTSLTMLVLLVLVCTLTVRHFTLASMTSSYWKTDMVGSIPGLCMMTVRMYLLCVSAAKVEEESLRADAILATIRLLQADKDTTDQVMHFSMQVAKNGAMQSAAGYFHVSKALFLAVMGHFAAYMVVAYQFLQQMPPPDPNIITQLAHATGRNTTTISAGDIDKIVEVYPPEKDDLLHD